MTETRISTRRAALRAVVLLIGVPVALQPARPWIAAHWPLAQPTVWQAATSLFWQFVAAGLLVAVYNQRQRIDELEQETLRWRHCAEVTRGSDDG